MRWGLIRSDCGELCITDEIGNTCCSPQRERERENTGREVIVVLEVRKMEVM